MMSMTKRELVNKDDKLELLMMGSATTGEENWPRNKQAVKVPMVLPRIAAGLSSKTQKLRLAINKPCPKPATNTTGSKAPRLGRLPVRKYPTPIIARASQATVRKENRCRIFEYRTEEQTIPRALMASAFLAKAGFSSPMVFSKNGSWVGMR